MQIKILFIQLITLIRIERSALGIEADTGPSLMPVPYERKARPKATPLLRDYGSKDYGSKDFWTKDFGTKDF